MARGGERRAAPEAVRGLPAIGRLVREAGLLAPGVPEGLLARAAREEVLKARSEIVGGVRAAAPPLHELAARTAVRARRDGRPGLAPVINATGVVIHTNLGRAPLAPEAVQAVVDAASGYCDLEWDLETGERGRRGAGLAARLAALVGAQAALAVNNNAAAVFLALRALASGRDVLVSRGELIEIGGAFRLPEIFAASGARLVEIGTTNRTHLHDYARGLDAGAGAVLKVHRSNFRLAGFTAEVPVEDLARLGRERGVPVLFDLGGGLVRRPPRPPRGWDEPTVEEAVRAGADVVCFSGDKLFGGPQAGIAVGRSEAVRALERDPLHRMVRIDKMTAAALLGTVSVYERGLEAGLPARAAAFADDGALRARAAALARTVRRLVAGREGVRVTVAPLAGRVGGGAAPEVDLPGHAVRVDGLPGGGTATADALRRGEPAVVVRAEDGAIWLDPRAVMPGQVRSLREALARALRPTA